MLSDGKQLPTINKTIDEDDYPNTKILDTYSLEFLDLPNEFSEKDLKNAIIKNLKDFRDCSKINVNFLWSYRVCQEKCVSSKNYIKY